MTTVTRKRRNYTEDFKWDAVALYPQEGILQRIGVALPRATLANWMIQYVINLLRDRLLAYDILQMDETPVQVLKEPGKTAQSKS